MSEEFDNKTVSCQENVSEAIAETLPTETEGSVGKMDFEVASTIHHYDSLLVIMKENRNLLHEIKDTIQNRLEYDSVKEKAIDKINDELKFYKDGFIFQSQKSIYVDLMLFYDSFERILNSIINGDTFSKDNIIEGIELLKEELLEILYRKDITPYDEHPEFLNYKVHKTVKTVPTDLENENNKVHKIIKIGFRLKDKILRPEEVIIWKYDKSKEERQ